MDICEEKEHNNPYLMEHYKFLASHKNLPITFSFGFRDVKSGGWLENPDTKESWDMADFFIDILEAKN